MSNRNWTALVISDELGDPPTSGYRRRTAQCVRLVAGVADTEWIAAPRRTSPEQVDQVHRTTGSDVATGHVVPAVRAVPSRPPYATAARWLTGTLPWSLAAADWCDADDLLATRRSRRYDLVWAMGFDACLSARRAGIRSAHLVVDSDLESEKLASRLSSEPGDGSWRHTVRTMIARSDVHRWRALERSIAPSTDAVCVPSLEEARLLGPCARYLPNTYDRPLSVAARPTPEGEGGPRIVFVGSLTYPPNVDALTLLANSVLPLLHTAAPTLRLQIVGRGLASQHPIRARPGVEVLENVDDVGHVLRGAVAAVVPLRWGGGTRIKVIEAFAHHVPVVSTSLGAAGLGAEHDQHLLIADDAEAFASACLQLVNDAELGRRLADAGAKLFAERFETSMVLQEATSWLETMLTTPERPTTNA